MAPPVRTISSLLRPTLNPSPTSLFLRLSPSIRNFHASSQRQNIEPLISSTHTILEAIHSTGLPWVYTLPIFALSLRLTILLPFTIISRRALQKQAELSPLLFAWSHSITESTYKTSAQLGPTVVDGQAKAAFARKQKELYSRWECERWKVFLPASQLPVWLVAVETIRRMCGSHEGLLGLAVGIFKSKTPEPEITNSTVTEAVTSSAAPLTSGTETLVSATAASDSIGIESSFATEGALWFPNLLLPDPELYLPVILGGFMMLNIAPWKVSASAPVWSRRLTRGLGMIALAVPIMTLKMPTAMLVYWISSSGLAILQKVILDKFMPVKAKVIPCKPKKKVHTEVPGIE